LNTLRRDIVPRLLEEVPDQPSRQQLYEDPCLYRFILVFDREGYSPAFFYEMCSKHRIACLTYHKHPDEPWPEQWFTEHEVTMPGGEVVTMPLCEMGSCVGSGKPEFVFGFGYRKLFLYDDHFFDMLVFGLL